jgi:hypothetical protein
MSDAAAAAAAKMLSCAPVDVDNQTEYHNKTLSLVQAGITRRY